MLDKLFRAHSETNGLGEKNGDAAMNGTASTKENPGVRRELSERPTPDMLRRTDSMTAFHAQKEFQDRTVSIGNDEREYFVSGCLLLLDCARGDLERVHATVKDSPRSLSKPAWTSPCTRRSRRICGGVLSNPGSASRRSSRLLQQCRASTSTRRAAITSRPTGSSPWTTASAPSAE